MQAILRRITRHAVTPWIFLLPWQRRMSIERWLRGWEDHYKLTHADFVFVSFGKSGRTWLRVMLSRFFQIRYHLPAHKLINFDNFNRKNASIPKTFFSHDNYIKDYTGNRTSKVDFYAKKVILLVRDPRDVAVSQYFQWRHRMRPHKKALNAYPSHGANVSMFDFVMNANAGLPKIIDFMNLWEREAPRVGDLLIVRYEDMRADPHRNLGQVLAFLGIPATPSEIDDAVTFAAYENMKKLEERKTFPYLSRAMRPGDRSNPDSYKVRRAKVAGYRDYFDNAQLALIDAQVTRNLAPSYGYGGETHSHTSVAIG